MHPFRNSGTSRVPALLLFGATTLGLPAYVSAQATVGGGTLVSHVTGTLVSAPVRAVPNPVTHMPGPSYGLGGPHMVLVKNWDFGTGGNVKNYDDLSANFFYHDQAGNLANGTYGASTASPDFQDSVNDTDVGNQPIEGLNYQSFGAPGYTIPPLRTFGADYLRTFLVPTYATAPTDPLTPYRHNAVASGSLMAKWRLPAGGRLLGQDLIWETKVLYLPPPNFWFSLWTNGSSEMNTHGAEADLIESFGFDKGGTNNNFDGSVWHSNMVPADTDLVDYSHFDQGMASAGYGPDTNPPNPYKVSEYHIWTWVYHKDDTYQMYVDGKVCQQSKPNTTYPWTANASPALAAPIDPPPGARRTSNLPAGAPSDLEFRFDNSWGNITIPGQTDFSVQAQKLAGTYYQYKYSRVYLSGGDVAERAFGGKPNVSGTPPSIPCTVHFSDYDTGGEGSGYHLYADPDAKGTGYRADNNKHVYTSPSPGGNGCILGRNIPHEWYKYTVTLPKPAHDSAAVVTATFLVNCHHQPGGKFHLDDENGNDLSGEMTVPALPSHAKNPWQTITSQPFSLNAAADPVTGASGTHTLRLVMDTNSPHSKGVCDFSWMHLDYAGARANTLTANALANSSFTTPILFSNVSGTSNVYDVLSSYLYNPTGNGWPMSAWTYKGNAGITGTTDAAFGAAPLPLSSGSGFQTQFAFVESPIASQYGGGIYAGSTGGKLGSISQTLSLSSGTYSLSFEASQVYTNGQSQPIQVLLDDTPLGAPITPTIGTWGPPGSPKGTQGVIYSVPKFTIGRGGSAPGLHTITLAAANNATAGLVTFIANVTLNVVPAAARAVPAAAR